MKVKLISSFFIAVFVLSGCQSAQTPEAGASATEPSSEASEPANGSDVEPAPEANNPSATPEPDESLPEGYVEGDMYSWDDWLDYVAEVQGLENPPEVEPIREIRDSERAETHVNCLIEFGIDASIAPNGAIAIEHGPGQSLQVGEAVYTCYARYPSLPQFYLPYSDEILTRFHKHLTEVSVPCVEAAGYDLKLRSLDTFLAQYKIDRSFYDAQVMSTIPNTLYDQCEFNSIPEHIIMGE